jgi:hypothetical protein
LTDEKIWLQEQNVIFHDEHMFPIICERRFQTLQVTHAATNRTIRQSDGVEPLRVLETDER